MRREEASRKGGAVEVGNLREKKKENLGQVFMSKALQTPLKFCHLCFAQLACVAKAASQITTDLAQIKLSLFQLVLL